MAVEKVSLENGILKNSLKDNQQAAFIYNKDKYYFLPYGILSPISSVNPFINHMKSVRSSYSCP